MIDETTRPAHARSRLRCRERFAELAGEAAGLNQLLREKGVAAVALD